jgi:hypothetical protein
MSKLKISILLTGVIGATTLFSQRQYDPIPVEDENTIFKKKSKFLLEQYIPKLLMPGDTQLLKEVCPMNESMEGRMGNLTLQDQSNWKVRPSHVSRLPHWKPGHWIALTQNNSLFTTKFPYRLINYTLNKGIDVKFYSGPDSNSRNINTIKEIDYQTGKILFNNGRRGKMRQADLVHFKLWKKDDIIMNGVNSGKGDDYKHILINTTIPEQLEKGHAVLCNLVLY